MKKSIGRRSVVAALGALGALSGQGASAQLSGLEKDTFDAWLYVLPLIEMARARSYRRADGRTAPINAITHARRLAGPQSRAITTPNCDTIYSSAFVDLTKGPVTVVLPAAGQRYFSVAVLDMYTDADVMLGTGTAHAAAGGYRLIGHNDAPSNDRDLRLATPHGWLLARVLVAGEDDLRAARRVQEALVVSGPETPPPEVYATRAAPWPDYFRSALRLLQSDPPRFLAGHDAFERVRRAGAGGDFDRCGYSAGDAAAIGSGVAKALALAQSGGRPRNFVEGWSYPPADLGNYGDNFIERAVVAVAGLGALPPAAAMYMRAAGDDGGGLFHGDGLYRFSLKEPIPVKGFWSLTMYEATPDGQFFLTENRLDRYAIGDRTAGLARRSDGGLDIWIGRHDPGEVRRANWLPAPAAGSFALTLRAYVPESALLEGRYRLPAIVPQAG